MTAHPFEPGPLVDDVRCEPTGDRWTLIFVRDLRHPPTKVWAALTEPGQLARWAPYTADRDLGATGAATLTMLDAESATDAGSATDAESGTDGGAAVPMPTEVLRAEPPTLLEYGWGGDVLRWELNPTGDGTRLTLRHTVTDRDAVPMMAAGWHICLAVAQRLLEGDPVDPIRGDVALDHGWIELRDGYRDRLAPDR
jgi:uncharacterized protein YndB with AHSA1/START domain